MTSLNIIGTIFVGFWLTLAAIVLVTIPSLLIWTIIRSLLDSRPTKGTTDVRKNEDPR